MLVQLLGDGFDSPVCDDIGDLMSSGWRCRRGWEVVHVEHLPHVRRGSGSARASEKMVASGPSCTRLVCQPGPGIRDAEGVEDVHGVVGERVEGGVLVAGDRDGDFLQGTQGPHDLPDRHPGRVLQIA